MQAREAWNTVSTAFDDLASLAEACEDDRLENYPDLNGAFQAVARVIAEAETVMHSAQTSYDGGIDEDFLSAVDALVLAVRGS